MKRATFVLLGLVGACGKVLGFQAGELDDRESEGAAFAGASEASLAGAPGEGGTSSISPVAGAAGDVGGAPAGCGDQELQPGEECDGAELEGATCSTAGERAGGALGCDRECHYDFAACYAVEAVAVSAHVCAVFSNGKLKCWGQNGSGQLGLGDLFNRGEEKGEMGAQLPFVPLGEARVKQVAVGARHTCVLLDDNQLRCWGENLHGQLGVPDVDLLTSAAEAPPLALGPEPIESIETGAWHTCAAFASGKVKCWGSNYSGQLGLGDLVDRGKQTGDLGEQLPFIDLGAAPVTQLSAGAYHTCALGPWGAKCWGAIAHTQVVPEDLLALGDQPFEMGENLPLIDLALSSLKSITSGGWHNCARSPEGAVKCWGDNGFGQLGYGDYESRIDLGRLGAELAEVDLDGSVVALSAGSLHTCALLSDNRLKCWGSNESGQLGLGDAEDRGGYPDQMGPMLPAVDLGRGHTIVGIQAGEHSSCAILDRGRLKCWGHNFSGVLGLGHQRPVGLEPSQMGDALAFVEL